MAEFDDRILRSRADVGSADIDQGLRSYMLGIYNYMALGVALTGIVAYFTSTSPAMVQLIYGTPLKWAMFLAPLAFILVMNMGLQRLSAGSLQAIFWAFAAVMGLSMAAIFVVYTGESIARVFFITTASFAALSLYGYTTKRDLGPWRTFLMMGVFGVFFGMIFNYLVPGITGWYEPSTAFGFALSVIAVLVFAGLTAWDTQNLKNQYYEVVGNNELMAKVTILGATSLYINFVVMFSHLLSLLGDRE